MRVNSEKVWFRLPEMTKALIFVVESDKVMVFRSKFVIIN